MREYPDIDPPIVSIETVYPGAAANVVETRITQLIEDSYTHKKQSGGSGQYGKIDYRIEPAETNEGYVFESLVTGGNVPREYWGAIEKAFQVSMDEGTMAGFPLLDVKFTLLDGGFHAVDSSALAFEIATKAAYRQSVPKAGPL